MSEQRRPKKRRRRVAQDERGFWGFILIVLAGAVAVFLSMIA